MVRLVDEHRLPHVGVSPGLFHDTVLKHPKHLKNQSGSGRSNHWPKPFATALVAVDS